MNEWWGCRENGGGEGGRVGKGGGEQRIIIMGGEGGKVGRGGGATDNNNNRYNNSAITNKRKI